MTIIFELFMNDLNANHLLIVLNPMNNQNIVHLLATTFSHVLENFLEKMPRL